MSLKYEPASEPRFLASHGASDCLPEGVWIVHVWAILEQILYMNVQRFRGGLVFKAHRLLYWRGTNPSTSQKNVNFANPSTGTEPGRTKLAIPNSSA